MSEFQKVLVVDDGNRPSDHALSADLAELGFASVTTSVDATDDVLELISAPAAILLQLPKAAKGAIYERFMDLAARLKAKQGAAGIPVIVLDTPSGLHAGGYASVLESELGAHALSKPEL